MIVTTIDALFVALSVRHIDREELLTLWCVFVRLQPMRSAIASTFEVRELIVPAAPRELQAAAAMLACAFEGSPLFRSAFPQPASRGDILRRLFVAVVEDAARFGRVEIAYDDARDGKIVGMLIWYPPGAYPMSAPRLLRFLPRCAGVAAANPLGVVTLCRAQRTLDRLRPKRPHCHGYFLGGRQGERVGSALIRRVLRQVDENDWPIYLETQEQRLTKLYARFGFETLQERVETFPGGPFTWTMWREPRRSA